MGLMLSGGHQAASREAQLEEAPRGADLCTRKETRGPERLPGAPPVTLSTMLPVFCLSVQAPSWKLSSPRADGSHHGPLALNSGAGWGTAPTVAWWLMRADGRKPAQTYRRLNRKGFFHRSLQCRLDSQGRAQCPPRHIDRRKDNRPPIPRSSQREGTHPPPAPRDRRTESMG